MTKDGSALYPLLVCLSKAIWNATHLDRSIRPLGPLEASGYSRPVIADHPPVPRAAAPPCFSVEYLHRSPLRSRACDYVKASVSATRSVARDDLRGDSRLLTKQCYETWIGEMCGSQLRSVYGADMIS